MNNRRKGTRVCAAPRERGIALVIVMLMLTVLTTLGFLVLYSSTIERDIARAHSARLLARNAAAAGAELMIRQVMSSKGYKLDPYPNATLAQGVGFGNYLNHPVIGTCYVLDHKCGNPFSGLNAVTYVDDLCCFRTGPLRDLTTGNLMTPAGPNDIVTDVNKRYHLKYEADLDIVGGEGGGGDYTYYVRKLWISGGGPGRSVSEMEALIKTGPAPKGGAGGTTYGSQTGISAT